MHASKPFTAKFLLSINDRPLIDDPTTFHQTVGSLQYLTFARPDIAFAVNVDSQYMQAPRETHLQAIKPIRCYPMDAIDHDLLMRKDSTSSLMSYYNADWTGCLDNRRSTTGFCIFLVAI